MTFNDNARIDTSKVQRRTGGRGARIGGGSLASVLLIAVASQLLGFDVTPIANMLGVGPGSTSTSQEQVVSMDECQTGADANADDNCRMAAASDSIDRYWQQQMTGYRAPEVVIYSGATSSPCGTASAAIGPFYCPTDEGIYIDTSFWGTLRGQFGASAGPLAQMYVLAHEWGHHISKLVGSLDQSNRGTGAASGSVRLELQADCFAGAWVSAASGVTDAYGTPFLKEPTRAEINDALNAAAAVGDDHIQRRSGRDVNPDSFSHGSSEQRQRWFMHGYENGAASCDTFAVAASQL